MAVTAQNALPNLPVAYQIELGVGVASGTISPGDWVAYSGTAIFATNAGHTAFWKASGIGVALEANPLYDWAGRTAQNTALRLLRQGVLRVTAEFSGIPAYGVGAYPVATGSAVGGGGGITGGTGRGARWQTGAKQSVSGGTGVGGSGVAIVVGHSQVGAVAGTGQIDIMFVAARPDYF